MHNFFAIWVGLVKWFEITVCPNKGQSFKVTVDIVDSTTTSDVLEIVKEIACEVRNEHSSGKWVLYEGWRGVERSLPRENFMQLVSEWGGELDDVRYVAREKRKTKSLNSSGKRKKKKGIDQLYKELSRYQDELWELRLTKIKKSTAQQPTTTNDPARKGLLVISSLNKKLEELKSDNKKLSLEVSEMNHEATRLSEHLTALRSDSQQVVDLLTQLKTENQLKREKEGVRKEEELRRINESVHQVQQELEKRQRMTELQDSKIRIVQDDIDHMKTILKSKQSELEQLKEWAREKRQRDDHTNLYLPVVFTQQQQMGLLGSAHSQVATNRDPEPVRHVRDDSFGYESTTSLESTSSIGSGFSRRASGSIRRRFADFEDRTRRILEEESQAFKDANPKHERGKQTKTVKDTNSILPAPTSGSTKRPSKLPLSLEPSTNSSSPPVLISPLSSTTSTRTVPTPLAVPESPSVSTPIYSSSPSSYSLQRQPRKKPPPSVVALRSTSLTSLSERQTKATRGILRRRSSAGSTGSGKRRGIRFAPEAVILNAAWEGELDLLKNCIRELGSSYKVISGLGVTCLHNAVCSGNLEMIDHLIQLNCDINTQDYQGWTPLHCATAYCIYGAIQLLIKNGASLFLTTVEDMTPVDIAKEEMDGTGREEAKLCHQYLQDYQLNLGVANNGVVYALFSYTPDSASYRSGHRHYHSSEPKDMALIKGEGLVVTSRGDDGWWEVEDSQGVKGVVPSSYLGLYPPHQVLL